VENNIARDTMNALKKTALGFLLEDHGTRTVAGVG